MGELWNALSETAAVVEDISTYPTETHLFLAMAYVDMGVSEDALDEFALALCAPNELTVVQRAEATATLLDRRWLRLSVEETLSIIRDEQFAN